MSLLMENRNSIAALLSIVTPAAFKDARLLAKITKDGSNVVSSWANVHNSALPAEESTNKPLYVANAINNLPAIQFHVSGGSGASQLVIADDAALNYTHFYAITVFQRVTDTGAAEMLVGKFATGSPANQREWNMQVDTSDRLAAVGSNDGTATVNPNVTGAISTGVPAIGETWADGTNLTVVKNGNLSAAGTASLASVFNGTSPYYFGARDSLTNPYAGYIGMHLFTTTLPTAEQRLAIRKIAAGSWGVVI